MIESARRSPVERVNAILERLYDTRLYRAYSRYSSRNGDLLAGGLALTSLLSLTAALTLAITVFMAILGGDEALRESFFAAINEAVPNLLRTEDSPTGLVDPTSLVLSDAVSITGAIALAIMAWSALSVVSQLSRAIRQMFSLAIRPPVHPILDTARAAIGAIGLGAALVLGAGLGIAADLAGSRILDLVGIDSASASATLVSLGSNGAALLVHALVTWLLIDFVARVRPPWRDLTVGVLLIGTASVILRIAGTALVSTIRGPLLQTATALVAVIVWINLQMRITLMGCAWIANPPRAYFPDSPDEVHFHERPNFVTVSHPDSLSWPHHPGSGEIAPDTRNLTS